MKILFYFLGSILLAACAGPAQKDGSASESEIQDPRAETSAAPTETNTNLKADTKSVYQLILDTDTIPGRLDTKMIGGLSEPVRALAAFYAAMGGTNCDGEKCELTTALGLGKQGSDEHKKLINSYFPGDPVAAAVVAQDCYLRPSSASTFSDFEYLTIIDQGDTVKVDYNLMYYNHGRGTHTEGPDTYVFRNGVFTKVKRNLWAHVDEQKTP